VSEAACAIGGAVAAACVLAYSIAEKLPMIAPASATARAPNVVVRAVTVNVLLF
jgi:hypothetical protein